MKRWLDAPQQAVTRAVGRVGLIPGPVLAFGPGSLTTVAVMVHVRRERLTQDRLRSCGGGAADAADLSLCRLPLHDCCCVSTMAAF